MKDLFKLILGVLPSLFKSRAKLEAEILILRQQINVLRRRASPPSLARLRLSGRRPVLSENSIRPRFASSECSVAIYQRRRLRAEGRAGVTLRLVDDGHQLLQHMEPRWEDVARFIGAGA